MPKDRFNVFEYLYYRSTLLYSKIESRAGFEDNKMTGAWVVSTCISVNFITIILPLLHLLTGEQLSKKEFNHHDIKVIGALLAYVIINLSTLIFLTKKYHNSIFEKYAYETTQQKAKREVLIVVYLTLTFVALIVVAMGGKEFIENHLS